MGLKPRETHRENPEKKNTKLEEAVETLRMFAELSKCCGVELQVCRAEKWCVCFLWNHPILDQLLNDLPHIAIQIHINSPSPVTNPNPRRPRTRSLEERGQSEHDTTLLEEKICWK